MSSRAAEFFGERAASATVPLWPRLPARVRIVSAPLAAVAAATAATALFDLSVGKVEVAGLAGVIDLPDGADLAAFGEGAVLGTVLAFARIASAESLFRAAAADRLPAGRTVHLDT
ncbi:hypothetical protein ACWDRR_19935 [Kitasatospora sp. NPDC003701]